MTAETDKSFFKHKGRKALLGFTLAYFVIEIVINLIVFKQLAVKSDPLTIQAMEFWGKGIAGIGLALAIAKMTAPIGGTFSGEGLAHPAVSKFLLLCLVCVPASFLIQNAIIYSVVSQSTEEERNHAYIVSTVSSTIKPTFMIPGMEDKKLTFMQKLMAPLPGERDVLAIDYHTKQDNFISASKACVSIGEEALGVSSKLDKAFFAYNAYKNPPNHALYKSVITDYYSCLFKQPAYQKIAINVEDFNEFYFYEAIGPYDDGVKEYNKAKHRIESYGNKKSDLKKLDKEWAKQTRKLIGFKTDLPPNLSKDEFLSHPDVKKSIIKKSEGKLEGIYPYDGNYKENVMNKTALEMIKNLPDLVMPSYVDIETGKPSWETLQEAKYKKDPNGEHKAIESYNEYVDVRGEQAYKGIIMPMIALGASLFFLIVNLLFSITGSISAVQAMSSKKGKPVKGLGAVMTIVGLVLILSIPNSRMNEDPESIGSKGMVIKTIYYYEGILTKIFVRDDSNK